MTSSSTPRRRRPGATFRHLLTTVACCLAVVAVIPTSAGAAPLPPSECSSAAGFVVNYLNGVSNTRQQAQRSALDLRDANGTSHAGEPIDYQFLYNDTHGQIADVVEVFDQKIREAVEVGILTTEQVNQILSKAVGVAVRVSTTPTRALAWLMARVPIDAIRDAGNGLAAFLDAMPGWYETASNKVNQWMADQVRRFADESLLDAETLRIIDGHVATVRGQIASGKKSLIVSHSQGNLFANPVATRVRAVVPTNSLGVVHVATPALLRSGPYVTIDTDVVIAPFFLANQAPQPNAHLDALKAGSNHGFGDAYLLDGYEPRTKVLATISSELDSLVVGTGSGSDGLFTVTLTWAGAGDVDLHVVEPSGRHVYYGAQSGLLGYLDVDNVVADGPEHYYAACDSDALVGDFLVGVTNYRAPTSVPIQVQVASSTYVGDPVSIDIGGATSSSQMSFPLFRVEARRDAQGRIQVHQLPV